MFKYGSNLLEDMVHDIVKELGLQHSSMNHIPNVNDNEKTILFLSYQWMEAIRRSDEDRLNIHKQQFHFVMYSIGPMVNYLTEDEWAETEQEWNVFLAHLRSFNGSFLGLLHKRNLINSHTADFYNLIAWIVGLYSMFGNNVYSKLRPKIIQDQQSQAFIDSNKCMTTLYMNMMDFFIRHQIVDRQEELINFINQGLKLIIDFPGGSWENHFDQLTEPPPTPAFSIR